MGWTAWIMPVAAVGLSLYAKSKTSARVKWFLGTEEGARSTPIGLFLAKLQTGNELPPAPEGFRWKPIRMLMALSPVAVPTEVDINVLEPFLNSGQPIPASVKGIGAFANPFLTEREAFAPKAPAPLVESVAPFWWSKEVADMDDLGRHRRHRHHHHHWGGGGWGWGGAPWWYGYPPYVVYTEPIVIQERSVFSLEDEEKKKKEEEEKKKKEKKVSGFLGEVAGAADLAVRRLGAELAARGLTLARIAWGDVGQGDFVVTRDCKLHVVRAAWPTGWSMPGHPFLQLDLEEIHPSKGRRRRATDTDVACAFGVRAMA